MTFVRMDDHFPQHPKALALDDPAFAMHVRAICYASTQLSDGMIRPGSLPLLTRHRKPLSLVASLVKEGLWEPMESGWMIHDYLDWQESRVSVLAKRDAAKARMQRFRSQHVRTNNERSSREVQECSPEVRELETETEIELNPPVVPPSKLGASPAKRRGSGIPDDWEPSDNLKSWAATKHPTVSVDRETEAFLNHAEDKGRTSKSWDAAWRNWIIKAETIGKPPSGTLPSSNGHSGVSMAGSTKRGWNASQETYEEYMSRGR